MERLCKPIIFGTDMTKSGGARKAFTAVSENQVGAISSVKVHTFKRSRFNFINSKYTHRLGATAKVVLIKRLSSWPFPRWGSARTSSTRLGRQVHRPSINIHRKALKFWGPVARNRRALVAKTGPGQSSFSQILRPKPGVS